MHIYIYIYICINTHTHTHTHTHTCRHIKTHLQEVGLERDPSELRGQREVVLPKERIAIAEDHKRNDNTGREEGVGLVVLCLYTCSLRPHTLVA